MSLAFVLLRLSGSDRHTFFHTAAGFAGWWFKYLGTGTVLYSILTALLILFFAYFYAQIQFNPADVSLNIQQHGGFIPGIRPGKPTQDYLNKILNYIVFIGAVFLIIVALIPVFFSGMFNANVSFGGTSLIIIVGVVVDTIKQVESKMIVRNYSGFLND